MAVGAETLVGTWRRSLLWLSSGTRPNPHEVLFHLRDHRSRQLCSLGKLSQIDNGIALYRYKLGANSAGNIVSNEYVSLHQNKAEMLARSFSLAIQGN